MIFITSAPDERFSPHGFRWQRDASPFASVITWLHDVYILMIFDRAYAAYDDGDGVYLRHIGRSLSRDVAVIEFSFAFHRPPPPICAFPTFAHMTFSPPRRLALLMLAAMPPPCSRRAPDDASHIFCRRFRFTAEVFIEMPRTECRFYRAA